MSGKIKLNAASGGGSVSIQAPSSESNNRTLTLPSDADGTIVSKDASNNLAEVASINGGSIGTNNLVINGACLVSQRGQSSTDNGYGSVDRFKMALSNVDENPTQAQADVASGTTPYSLGFRKAFKVTNGNQTSGAQATDVLIFTYNFEAQDIANSGWNYTSSSSDISLSFWVKSSVAQNFFIRLVAFDGTPQAYSMETGSLSANTWTKVTKTIPGNSNLTFDNDVDTGLRIEFIIYRGTNFTGSVTLNQWAANDDNNRNPDCTSTWYTTNDATFEITGVQVEVGSTASAFAHESYADTFLKCQRYYHVIFDGSIHQYTYWQMAYYYNSTTAQFILRMNPEMRATPSLECTSTSGVYRLYRNGSYNSLNDFSLSHSSKNSCRIYNSSASGTAGQIGGLYVSSNGSGNEMIALSAEL